MTLRRHGPTGVALWLAVAAPALAQNSATPPRSAGAAQPAASVPPQPKTTGERRAPPSAAPVARQPTPMAERVATVGILNKRNGLHREFRIQPGRGVRIGDMVVKVRACERTQDWEAEQLTGVFAQLFVKDPDRKWRRYFSGWLYKETPSLNVVEHPVYDVWVRDCAMQWPEVGPDTVVLPGGPSNARKSATPSRNAEASRER